MEDVVYSDGADAKKPCYDDRCKQESYPVGPVVLEEKQKHQYDTSNWDFNICRIKFIKQTEHEAHNHIIPRSQINSNN